MNWDAIGAIGEILGAIAVVATLAYLALQIKQARKATLADVYQNRAHSRAAATLQVALNSPTFHKTLFKFQSSLESNGVKVAVAELSDEEKFLVSQYYQDLMVRMDNLHFQYQQGFIPEEYFETGKRGLRIFAPIWKALGVDRIYPVSSRDLFESFESEDD